MTAYNDLSEDGAKSFFDPGANSNFRLHPTERTTLPLRWSLI
jgi:hypothetical protein